MSSEEDLIQFPTPPTKPHRELIGRHRTLEELERFAHHVLRHIDRTTHGIRCPYCRLRPDEPQAP